MSKIINTVKNTITKLPYGTVVSVRWDSDVGKWAIVEVSDKTLKIVKYFSKAILEDCKFTSQFVPDFESCSPGGYVGLVTGTIRRYHGTYPAEAKTFAFKNDRFVDGITNEPVEKSSKCYLHPARRAMYI